MLAYDGANRLLSQSDGAFCADCATQPITTTPGYDPAGQVTQVVRRAIAVRATTRPAGCCARTTGRAAVLNAYDKAGRLVGQSLLDGQGAPTGGQINQYDAAGRVIRSWDAQPGAVPLLAATTYTYTATDLPLTVTLNSASGNSAVSEASSYDAADRLTALQLTGPHGLTASYHYAYDAQGHITALSAPVLDTNSPDHDTVLSQALHYNAVGALIQADGIRWMADGNRNLLSETPSGGTATLFAYTYSADPATNFITPTTWLPNELAYVSAPEGQSGHVRYYAYDGSGNTTAITETTAQLTFTKTIRYNAAGLPVMVLQSDPTLSTSGHSVVTVTYNARGCAPAWP